jgi:hypothetical protein
LEKTSRKLKTKRREEKTCERDLEKAQLPKRRARQNEAGMETIGKEEGGEGSWRRGKESDEELEISDLIKTRPGFSWERAKPSETKQIGKREGK